MFAWMNRVSSATVSSVTTVDKGIKSESPFYNKWSFTRSTSSVVSITILSCTLTAFFLRKFSTSQSQSVLSQQQCELSQVQVSQLEILSKLRQVFQRCVVTNIKAIFDRSKILFESDDNLIENGNADSESDAANVTKTVAINQDHASVSDLVDKSPKFDLVVDKNESAVPHNSVIASQNEIIEPSIIESSEIQEETLPQNNLIQTDSDHNDIASECKSEQEPGINYDNTTATLSESDQVKSSASTSCSDDDKNLIHSTTASTKDTDSSNENSNKSSKQQFQSELQPSQQYTIPVSASSAIETQSHASDEVEEISDDELELPDDIETVGFQNQDLEIQDETSGDNVVNDPTDTTIQSNTVTQSQQENPESDSEQKLKNKNTGIVTDEKNDNPTEKSSSIPIGTPVKIEGLQKNTHYNGHIGVIILAPINTNIVTKYGVMVELPVEQEHRKISVPEKNIIILKNEDEACEQYMNLSGTFFTQQDYRKALIYANQLYELAPEKSRYTGIAARLIGTAKSKLLSASCEDSNHNDEIASHFKEALQLSYLHNDFLSSFNTLTAMGSVAQSQKNTSAAEVYYLQALELTYRDLEGLGWKEAACACTNLASVLTVSATDSECNEDSEEAKATSDKAFMYMKKAYKLHEENNPAFKGDYRCMKDVNSLAIFTCNFASYCVSRDKELAKMIYRQTKTLSQIAGNKRVYNAVLINLANQYQCKVSRKEISLNDQCCISLDRFDDPDHADRKFTVLECRHCFFSDCFQNLENFECPLCRSKLGFTA